MSSAAVGCISAILPARPVADPLENGLTLYWV
jgi:hypothetical protein